MGKNNTKREKMQRNEAYALKHKKKRRKAPSAPRAAEPLFSSAMPTSRTSFPAICSACSAPTTLPFEPVSGKPVYCRACFVALPKTPAPTP